MVEAMRPGLLTSVASPLTDAGWDCGRGSASSSVTQLAWRSSSSSFDFESDLMRNCWGSFLAGYMKERELRREGGEISGYMVRYNHS